MNESTTTETIESNEGDATSGSIPDAFLEQDASEAPGSPDPGSGPVDSAEDQRSDQEPTDEEPTDDFEDRIETGRWHAGLSAALVAGAGGMFLGNPTMVVAAAVGMAYVAYGYATRPPSLEVAVERELAETSPLPGEDVPIRVTVENVGDRPIPDLRVMDDVPEEFELVSGSPGHSCTLEPDDTVQYEYTVRARRGEHVVGPTVVVSRNVSGSEERRRELANGHEVSVQAGPKSVPLQEQTIPHTGRIETDRGGEGLEFHSTRQYNHGDPMNRIDWNRFASTNELTTVNYRQEESGVVVLLVDARSTSDVRRKPEEPDAVDLAEYAAERLVDSLLDHNDRVGVGLYGDGALLKPALGRAQGLRAKQFLKNGRQGAKDDAHVATTYRRRDVEFFRRHMRTEAQVVFVTPLVDDEPVDVVTRLEAHGHAVTVVTPDVTDTSTPGGTVARVERSHRIHDLREKGARVVEWSPEEPLYTTMARAERRWST